MEWCDLSVESVGLLMEEAEEQPELWEARPCYQSQGLVQLGGKDYSACPYLHLLSCFSCHILKQELCPSL